MTDGYSVDTQVGRIAAGELDSLWIPRTPRSGNRGVVLCHGRSVLAVPAGFQYTNSSSVPSSVLLAAYLATNGIPCVSGQFGAVTAPNGNNWANDQAMSRITSAWSLLQSAAGCASDKVCLYGISMGGGTAARYAMLNPTKVAAGYGTAPVSDINEMYTDNIAGFRAEIGTAWGVTYPTALPSGANLSAQAALAAAIPWRLDYGGKDTVVLPATVTALAAAWGANCVATQVDNTLDHGDALFGKTDPQAVFAHFVANGA